MNKLICGDNLEVMEGLADASIDLICTDPPFCSQRDYGAFDDRWDDGLKGYLKFMRPRVEQMHRLLKETGSLYLHCDPSASHYLKVMLDEVFGRKHFRNEIVWKRTYGQIAQPKRKMPTQHDIVLFYAKTESAEYKQVYLPLLNRSINNYRKTDKDGRAYKEYKHKGKKKRVYLDKIKGRLMGNLWIDIERVHHFSNERTGYPTQKPAKLYERMIKASSNEGDIVLDPFCGSGTTLVAANNLGRYYIGIDEKTDAIEIAEQRLAQQNLFTGE